ncbi:MAG: hypothetical protein WC966_00755 [Bradymonadales bacterium]|jgi:hypothetical protein
MRPEQKSQLLLGATRSKAKMLEKKLELVLDGEAPYDIFVRWKAIEKQPIGWNPDLNDGDRINDHHLSLAEKRAAREMVESSP